MDIFLYADDTVAASVLADVLDRLGLGYRQLDDLTDLPLPSVLLVGSSRLEGQDWERVSAYLEAGGRVAFAQPEAHALALAGEEEPLSYPFPYLKIERGPFSHLQVLSPCRMVRQSRGQALARFCRDFSTTARNWASTYPAVAQGEADRGRWGLFLYDLPRTLLAFHQGHPLFSSTGDFPDPTADGKHRSTDLVYGLVHPELREVPQAQGHEMLLLGLLRSLTADLSPLPRLWPLPFPHTGAVILSGDSDNLGADRLRLALNRLGEWGLPYTLYIMPEDLANLSDQELTDFSARGIDFGLHYYHGSAPTVAEMERGLGEDRARMAARGLRPVSARGHSCIWVGWDEQARLLGEAGLSASSSFMGRLAYPTGTGLPYRFLSRSGERLPLWELPIYAGDDVTLTDKWGMPPVPEAGALQRTLAALGTSALLYGQPLTFCFHPHYFSGQEPATVEWVSGLGAACRERGHPLMNVAQWQDFWRSRCGSGLRHVVEGKEVKLGITGPGSRLGVAVPRRWAGGRCRSEGVQFPGTDEVILETASDMEIGYA